MRIDGLQSLVLALCVLSQCIFPVVNAFFGFSDDSSGVVKSSRVGCLGWRQTANCDGHGARDSSRDLECSMKVGSDRSGYCECTFGIVARTNCNHKRFSCEHMCLRGFQQMNSNRGFEWLENTIWNWNNWREVKFLENNVFWAPTPDCESQQCLWKAREDKIFIMWGDDGLHTITASKDRKRLTGKRYDGAKLTATFVRTLEEDGTDDDLYDILNVDVDASESEIRKAYRKLSRELHPDKAAPEKRDELEAKFIKVQEAYEILKDDDTRMVYDTGGLEAIEKIKDPSQQQRGMDPFSMLFGMGGGGGGRSNRGNDVTLQLDVSLELLYSGGETTHKFNRRVVCRRCSKITAKNKERCSRCRTRCPGEFKMVQRRMGNMLVQQQEEVASKEKCTMEVAELNVLIERGMSTGDEIKFERKNEQTPGQIPGDVIVKLKQKRHKVFERVNQNDLRIVLSITLKQALTGVDVTIKHLDGRDVRIVTDEVIYPKKVMEMKGEGMPFHNFPSQRGKLLIEFEIKFPKSLTEEQYAAISGLF